MAADQTRSLDQRLDAARRLELDPERVDRAVEQLLASPAVTAPVQPRGRRWALVLSTSWATAATAAAVVLLLLWSADRPEPPDTAADEPHAALVTESPLVQTDHQVEESVRPIRFGERVALYAPAESSYQVLAQDHGHTRIAVEQGTVAVRLFAGRAKHRLEIAAADIVAVATGTCYAVGLDEGEPLVQVYEGQVAVRRGERTFTLQAGQAWRGEQVVDRLLTEVGRDALLEFEPQAMKAIPWPEARPPMPVARAAKRPDTSAEKAPDRPADPIESWRHARLLVGQGRYEEAAAAFGELAELGHATWSPLALVELARLHSRVLAAPARVEKICEEFISAYPEHPLRPEVDRLRCDAQLHQRKRSRPCPGMEADDRPEE